MTECSITKMGPEPYHGGFRQILWRESLRSLCKHSIRVQTVLPHNVAWPFPFCPGVAANDCRHDMWRKRPLTLNMAAMLRKMVHR